MKRLMSVILVLVIMFSLFGCGGGNDLIGKWEIDLEEYDENNSGSFSYCVDLTSN